MPNSRGLNLYLIDPQIQEFVDALEEPIGLTRRELNAGLPFSGRVYIKFGETHEPGWAAFIQQNVRTRIDFPESESTAAVIFVRTATGLYAYTFGQGGRFMLKSEAIVPDFGKKVALSIIEPGNIRSVDLRTVRAMQFHSKLQASKGVQLGMFGVDTQQDYLRAVTGETRTQFQPLAARVTGADVLQFHSEITFDELGTRADAFAAAFHAGTYRNVEEFRWIDQVTAVRNPALLTQLNTQLILSITNGAFEFGPPEMIDWARGPSFAFEKTAAPADRVPLVGRSLLIGKIGQANLAGLSIADLKGLKLYVFYGNEPIAEGRWSAFECIEAETNIGAQLYVLSGGQWGAIASAFLQDIDDYLTTLVANQPQPPPAQSQIDVNTHGRLDEGAYIARYTLNDPSLAKIHLCGHRTNVGGREVEFCDVFTNTRDLLHFKIWRGSQTFSALAMQAANSAEFLMADAGFRSQCRAAVNAVNPQFPAVLADNFNPREYKVVFALIRREAGQIPFFSRLTLKRQAERIRGRGFQAAYVQISVQ